MRIFVRILLKDAGHPSCYHVAARLGMIQLRSERSTAGWPTSFPEVGSRFLFRE